MNIPWVNPGMNPGTLVPKCGLKIYLLLYKIILFLEKLNLLKKTADVNAWKYS